MPQTVDGCTGSANIASMWKQHFEILFNCLTYSKDKPDPVKYFGASMSEGDTNKFKVLTVDDIQEAVSVLKRNKACGDDSVYAEHIIHASITFYNLLTRFFNQCMVHGYLPAGFDISGFSTNN